MSDFFQFLTALFWYVLFCLVPVAWFSGFIHYLYSLPMRWRERSLFFLDIIETACDRGQTTEHAVLSAAETRDKVMGI